MRRFILAIAGVAALAACSSGGSHVAVPARAPVKAASVSLTITWPASRTGSARKRRPAYVSPATKSLTVSLDGTQLLEADDPVVAGSSVTKTYALPDVAPGMRTFTIALYDATGGTGNLLARSTTTQSIVLDAANALAITVDGELKSIGIVPVANPYLETGVAGATYTLVGPLAQTFALEPLDADGNLIVSPGKIPPLTLTSPSSTIVATAVAKSANTYTLAGPAPASAVTLTAAGSDLDANAVNTTFTAQILGALFVTDPVAHRVAVLDDRGDALALPSTAFPDIADTHNCGPHGIAYVPPTAARVTPELFVARCTGNPNNGGPGNIGAYDLLGNEIVLPTPAAPNMPQFLTYEPAADDLIVADSGNVQQDASIEKYALDGTRTFDNAGDHPRLFEQANAPNKIALDPSLAQPDYFISDGTGYVERYATDGTFVSKTAAGTSPGGIAYDANTKSYYVPTYYNFTGTPAGPARGTVLAFDASDAPVTTGTANATAFMGLSTRPTDVLVDPFNHVLYVADYAGNKIVTFSEDGSASTQFPSAVTSVVDPLGLAFAP